MKDKIIDDFNTYLQKRHIGNLKIINDGSELLIKTGLLNFKILADLALLGLAVYGTYTVEDKDLFFIPIVVVYLVVLTLLWVDFLSINNMKVDLYNKKMEVLNRNIFRRILFTYVLKKNYQYDFKDISSFIVRSNESFRLEFLRYFVDMRLKNGTVVPLISFEKEEHSLSFANFITSLSKE